MLIPLLLSLSLASNASGKTLVRTSPGTVVPMAGTLKPLITEDSGAVAHFWVKPSGIADTKGTAWVENGSIPLVGRSPPAPAGKGTLSDANYVSLGTGNDALDFAGNFTGVVVYSCNSIVADVIGVQNGTANSGTTRAGYFLELCRSSVDKGPLIKFMSGAAASDISAPVGQESTVVLNIACFGRTGTNGIIKINRNAAVTAPAGTITVGTSNVAKLGRYEGTGAAFSVGVLYEAYFTATAVSDAVCMSIANEVRMKLGITAW